MSDTENNKQFPDNKPNCQKTFIEGKDISTGFVNRKPQKEELIIVNNKIYAFCHGCGKMVRLNKPILGSLHICSNP